MGSDLGCCANVTRALLVIINIFFGALGIVVFGLGIWAIVENQTFSFLTGNSVFSGAALLIVAGIVTVIICVVGIIGAIFKARPLLVIYALVVVVIVVLEIVAGIVAFVFSDEVLETAERISIDAIKDYRAAADATDSPEDVNNAISRIQNTFGCCGYNNATDWLIYNTEAVLVRGFTAPECSMCNPEVDDDCATFSNAFLNRTIDISFNTTSIGCGTGASERLRIFAYVVGGVGIVFGVLEILGVLLALFLCCCITSARKQEVV